MNTCLGLGFSHLYIKGLRSPLLGGSLPTHTIPGGEDIDSIPLRVIVRASVRAIGTWRLCQATCPFRGIVVACPDLGHQVFTTRVGFRWILSLPKCWAWDIGFVLLSYDPGTVAPNLGQDLMFLVWDYFKFEMTYLVVLLHICARRVLLCDCLCLVFHDIGFHWTALIHF